MRRNSLTTWAICLCVRVPKKILGILCCRLVAQRDSHHKKHIHLTDFSHRMKRDTLPLLLWNHRRLGFQYLWRRRRHDRRFRFFYRFNSRWHLIKSLFQYLFIILKCWLYLFTFGRLEIIILFFVFRQMIRWILMMADKFLFDQFGIDWRRLFLRQTRGYTRE